MAGLRMTAVEGQYTQTIYGLVNNMLFRPEPLLNLIVFID